MLIAAYIAEALSLLMLMMPMLVLLTVVCWQMHYRMPTGGADPDSCPATYTVCHSQLCNYSILKIVHMLSKSPKKNHNLCNSYPESQGAGPTHSVYCGDTQLV